MEERTAPRVAWSVASVAALIAVGSVVLLLAGRGPGDPAEIAFAVMAVTFGAVGALITSRQPRNSVGHVFLAMAALAALSSLTDGYAKFEPVLPGHRWAAWANEWSIGLAFGLIVFVLLLFPHGTFLSRRWRVVGWINATAALVFVLSTALSPGPLPDFPRITNPVGMDALGTGFLSGGGFSWILFPITFAAGAVAVVIRLRRSRSDEREQMKWLAYSGVALAVSWFLMTGLYGVGGPAWGIAAALTGLAVFSLPVSVGLAILKYRLYDIDVVINKTVVYGLLAAFITLIYVGVVAGIGAIGSGAVFNSALLSAVATAIVALAFLPLRSRAQHLANRIVYGKRATPYEVLSEFSERVGGAYSTEDVLTRMARVVGEGTGAGRADVWLRVGGDLRRAASWPGGAEAEAAVSTESEDLPRLPHAEASFPVRHRGELLGALAIAKPPGEPLTPTEQKLLADLSAQAGLLLRNARLNAELRERLDQLAALADELRASRQRIVAAQDQERRRLERNIHDGAQQQLVALAVKLRLAENLAESDPERSREMLSQLKADAQDALNDLRDLARGIYPPLLADQGLVAALQAQARKSVVPVEVRTDSVGRYPQEVEAAVYFCVLEALQNIGKYSGAAEAMVELSGGNEELGFTVHDNGKGFDPRTTPRGSGLQNMSDRLEALGGRIDISSAPGRGTTVTGAVPALAAQPAAAASQA